MRAPSLGLAACLVAVACIAAVIASSWSTQEGEAETELSGLGAYGYNVPSTNPARRGFDENAYLLRQQSGSNHQARSQLEEKSRQLDGTHQQHRAHVAQAARRLASKKTTQLLDQQQQQQQQQQHSQNHPQQQQLTVPDVKAAVERAAREYLQVVHKDAAGGGGGGDDDDVNEDDSDSHARDLEGSERDNRYLWSNKKLAGWPKPGSRLLRHVRWDQRKLHIKQQRRNNNNNNYNNRARLQHVGSRLIRAARTERQSWDKFANSLLTSSSSPQQAKSAPAPAAVVQQQQNRAHTQEEHEHVGDAKQFESFANALGLGKILGENTAEMSESRQQREVHGATAKERQMAESLVDSLIGVRRKINHSRDNSRFGHGGSRLTWNPKAPVANHNNNHNDDNNGRPAAATHGVDVEDVGGGGDGGEVNEDSVQQQQQGRGRSQRAIARDQEQAKRIVEEIIEHTRQRAKQRVHRVEKQ